MQPQPTARPNPRQTDLTGRRFGRLVVRGLAPPEGGGGRRKWLCRCDCGGLKPVYPSRLVSGRVRSCGCLLAATGRRPAYQNARHGMTDRPLYQVWRQMIARCHSLRHKQFADYGGRGITVCARWRESFEMFAKDMGPRPSPRHSVDRIDNNRGYELGNARWATQREQSLNTRANVFLEFQGERRTQTEWAEITGIGLMTIRRRLERGWGVEKALLTPVDAKKRHRSYRGRRLPDPISFSAADAKC